MSAPQILMLAFLSLSLGISIADHGKPKTGTNNAIYGLIGFGLIFGLLWWGGFWR